MVVIEVNEHASMAVEAVENYVNQLLDLGWVPQGALSLAFEMMDQERFDCTNAPSRFFHAVQTMLHPGEGPLPE